MSGITQTRELHRQYMIIYNITCVISKAEPVYYVTTRLCELKSNIKYNIHLNNSL